MTELRTVIVTGAGSGIGRASALRFAQAGFNVIANGRRQSALDETADMAGENAHRIIVVTGDVGLENTARLLVARACELGGFGWLVNNAGVGWNYGLANPGSMSALKDTSAEQWREVLRINLDSVYFLCHAALQHFCAQGIGSIVNVSSGGGLKGMDDAHTYATAKAGIINLTRSLAKAYGRFGVRSNVIAPGFVDTDMVSSVLGSELNPFANEATRYMVSPMGRPGTPHEVADAIYFLGVDATYCNGAILSVDGGSLA
jgi:meso-butanediol dehydrogenase / (S,S)-butanediol dehydrogenase / diacetyl reductase